MIGTVITLCIAVSVLVHGVRSARRASAVEHRSDLDAIERARVEVTFLDLVDGWSTVPARYAPVIAELDRSLRRALAVGDRASAAAHAHQLLELLSPYRRKDIVDA